MTNKKAIITLVAISTLSLSALAGDKSKTIIYGDDNRVETYQTSMRNKKLADSTAGMLPSVELINLGDAFMLPPKSIQNSMGLCKDEKFSTQPSSVICSGFLIGPDLLVTAGHCVTTQARCDEVTFVFDYKINEKSKRADMIISKDSVYKCSKLLDAKLESDPTNKRDYALVKLDRVVKGKKPLSFRRKGMVSTNDSLVVIGHPSGLPQKVAAGGSVFGNSKDKAYFKTNLDTFGGNSGSAVFNDKTGVVEGILVRGAKDYIKDDESGCIIVNSAPEDITGINTLGESVSRILDIPSLKYRKEFLHAAAKGSPEDIKKYLDLGVSINITDKFNNTALHFAAKMSNKKVVKYLIENGIDYKAKNLMDKTAVKLNIVDSKLVVSIL